MSRQGRPSRKAVEALLSAVNIAIVGVIFVAAIPSLPCSVARMVGSRL